MSDQLAAQKPDMKFRHLLAKDGLSNNNINWIIQDTKGFIWIATEEGLNKYDGYKFTTYLHDPDNERSISDSFARTLFEDSQGTLWIGTFGGLNKFNREDETFTRYVKDENDTTSLSSVYVIAICEDRSGQILVGTSADGGGVNVLDRETQSFTRYQPIPDDSTSLSNKNVFAMLVDHSGVIWAGTGGGGLNKFDQVTGTFKSYGNHFITCLYEDKAGTLWVGTLRDGLCIFDPITEQFTNYRKDKNDPHSINDNWIYSIQEDCNGMLWIGTKGGGINVFDKASKKFISYENDPYNPYSLNNNQVSSVFEDRSGVLWVGTQNGGINYVDPFAGTFITYRNIPAHDGSLSNNIVQAVYEDKNGVLWVGTENGLNRYDEKNDIFTCYQNDSSDSTSLSNNIINTIYETNSGVFWVGTLDRLNRFDSIKQKFTRFSALPDDSLSLSNNNISTIYEDSIGNLWVGTYGNGFNRFEASTQKFTQFQGDPNAPDRSDGVHISVILEDRSRKLWIGSLYAGISLFDPVTEEIKFYVPDKSKPGSLSHLKVYSIYEDRSGIMWIGTAEGLNKFDRASETFTVYGIKDGLPNDVIKGILEDAQGDLWVSTNKGISEFDQDTKTFKNYSYHDGLPSISFNPGAYFKSPKTGKMFFGSDNGLTTFFPDSIETDTTSPPIVITDFQIFNKSVPIAVGEKNLPSQAQDTEQPPIITDETPQPIYLKKHISELDKITLSYKENVFSFEFAALSFSAPKRNKYAYMMEGFENSWNYVGNRRIATYTNLAHGEYVFRAKGSNKDDVWNEAGVSIHIFITPPWWKTIWAYMLFLGLILSAIYGFIKYRTYQLEKYNRELGQTVQKRTSELRNKNEQILRTQEQLIMQEKMASLGQMTAGIAHEIKNPLNFVTNFSLSTEEMADELKDELQKNKDKLNDSDYSYLEEIVEDIKQNSKDISKNSKRADSIVQSMMLHTRSEKAESRSVDINYLLEENVNLAYHGFRAQDIDFNVTIENNYDENIGTLKVIHQDLGRVFLNIINNACYAARQKQQTLGDDYSPILSVTTRKMDNRIEIRIRDNGLGISLEDRDKIFDPFFTTKPTGEGNTGLGLPISYDIVVQGHQGGIDVNSEPGEFTEFVIWLPR